MTYAEYLSTMTVKTLTEIAKQMDLKVSGLRKAELIAKLIERIGGWHVIALDMDKANFPKVSTEETAVHVVSFPDGSEVKFTGKAATVLIQHEKNLMRFNPNMTRDNDNKIRLTPKQRRRVQKKLRKYAKSIGFFDREVAV